MNFPSRLKTSWDCLHTAGMNLKAVLVFQVKFCCQTHRWRAHSLEFEILAGISADFFPALLCRVFFHLNSNPTVFITMFYITFSLKWNRIIPPYFNSISQLRVKRTWPYFVWNCYFYTAGDNEHGLVVFVKVFYKQMLRITFDRPLCPSFMRNYKNRLRTIRYNKNNKNCWK